MHREIVLCIITGMFDTHAHLDMLKEPLETVILNAAASGVTRILAVGTSMESNEFCISAAGEHRGRIYAAIGLDRDQAGPGHSRKELAEKIDRLEKMISANRDLVRAVGETGLDFHYRKDTAEAQSDLLKLQLELARKTCLPAVIHTREADRETLLCLEEHARLSNSSKPLGVIHCFTADRQFAETALSFGFMISFSGIITFRKSAALRAIASEIPENMILAETDSPFLAPEPFRGRENTPALLPHVIDCMAEIRGCPAGLMRETAENNALRLFEISRD